MNTYKYYSKSKGTVTAVLAVLLLTVITISSNAQGQERTQNRYRGGESGKILNIVCSFSDYATIAEFIAGNRATVTYIAHGEQDPHFVPPKPSYAVTLSKADLWITTGMDLEMWAATLVDKAITGRSWTAKSDLYRFLTGECPRKLNSQAVPKVTYI